MAGSKPSFASIVNNNVNVKRKVNFRLLETNLPIEDGVDLTFPKEVVIDMRKRYDCTIFGYFLGNRVSFPVVERYVGNVWKKYGLEKAMMSASGFYYFKFSSDEGVIKVLEEGPWMIRNMPIILKRWSPDMNVSKADITRSQFG